MSAPTTAGRRSQALRILLEDPAVQAALREEGTLPEDARVWLGRLCLLGPVPFTNLVPDARMLPRDSIRFFFVDRNWLDALVDGALAAVNASEFDTALVELLREQVQEAAIAAARADRRRALGDPTAAAPAPDPNAPAWSGFLLRSAVVSDWPGLTVAAYGVDDQPLPLLRLETVGPGVLLALFDGVSSRFELAKPLQGLHFGVEDNGRVFARSVEGGSAGKQLLDRGDPQRPLAVTAPWRDERRGVLDVTALRGALKEPIGSDVTPGALGIQLVRAAERQSFVPEGGSG